MELQTPRTKRQFHVTVEYDLSQREWGAPDDQLEALAGKHGGQKEGGGTGAGFRDQGFLFLTRNRAEKFANAVKRTFSDMTLHVNDWVEDHEEF